MKKHLLLLIFCMAGITLSAQVVITGWTFPTDHGPDSLNANLGLAGNLGYDLRFEGPDTTYDVIYFSAGITDYAAAAKGWAAGANEKYWSIKFKAADYKNFKVSSRQYSSDVNAGPRDFKLQWRLSSGVFADVPNGTIIVANDWTSGVITDLPVPITDQGSSSIYICWLVTSDIDINGGTLSPEGENRIDDILVTAENALGEREILYSDRITISPNPNKGQFTVSSLTSLDEIRLTDLNGRVLLTLNNPGFQAAIAPENIRPGTYLLSVRFSDNASWYTQKVVVE